MLRSEEMASAALYLVNQPPLKEDIISETDAEFYLTDKQATAWCLSARQVQTTTAACLKQ